MGLKLAGLSRLVRIFLPLLKRYLPDGMRHLSWGATIAVIAILVVLQVIVGAALLTEDQVRDIFPTLEHMWSSGWP